MIKQALSFILFLLPRDARGIAIVSRPSVCLSVTLWYHGRMLS